MSAARALRRSTTRCCARCRRVLCRRDARLGGADRRLPAQRLLLLRGASRRAGAVRSASAPERGRRLHADRCRGRQTRCRPMPPAEQLRLRAILDDSTREFAMHTILSAQQPMHRLAGRCSRARWWPCPGRPLRRRPPLKPATQARTPPSARGTARSTCLKEAGAALAEARRGQLDAGRTATPLERPWTLRGAQRRRRRDCIARAKGQSTTVSGRVEGAESPARGVGDDGGRTAVGHACSIRARSLLTRRGRAAQGLWHTAPLRIATRRAAWSRRFLLDKILLQIAAELKVRPAQVLAAVELLDGGATVPFIARYRKEATDNLDDIQLRELEARLSYLRELEERRAAVLESIDGQGKLTPALRAAIDAAPTKQELEDLYLPYRQKRRTRAMIRLRARSSPWCAASAGTAGTGLRVPAWSVRRRSRRAVRASACPARRCSRAPPRGALRAHAGTTGARRVRAAGCRPGCRSPPCGSGR